MIDNKYLRFHSVKRDGLLRLGWFLVAHEGSINCFGVVRFYPGYPTLQGVWAPMGLSDPLSGTLVCEVVPSPESRVLTGEIQKR